MRKLTGCQRTSIEVPFDDHGRIANWFDAGLHVNTATFGLLHILQRDDELRRWIDAILLTRAQMGLGALHMAKVDDFRARNGSNMQNITF